MMYESNENYIFISYSHDDSEKVLPYIDVLQKHGFCIWYDAGIEAGTEWPEYIEEHIKNATSILVFMTPNTVASRNCRNEINFALDLEKDILIVYLEDTELLKGMRLQLNSTQSLFRKNHQSDETFVSELISARMIQSCRDNAKYVAPQIVETKTKQMTQVAMVNSIGTNDRNDYWPNGKYSQTINRDEFSVVCFHMNLLKAFKFSGQIVNKYKIYNSDNNLIFDDEMTLNVEPDYDRVALSWVLKGEDGSFIPSGEYRFVCSINNSPDFTYHFTVTSNGGVKQKKSLFSKIKKILEE